MNKTRTIAKRNPVDVPWTDVAAVALGIGIVVHEAARARNPDPEWLSEAQCPGGIDVEPPESTQLVRSTTLGAARSTLFLGAVGYAVARLTGTDEMRGTTFGAILGALLGSARGAAEITAPEYRSTVAKYVVPGAALGFIPELISIWRDDESGWMGVAGLLTAIGGGAVGAALAARRLAEPPTEILTNP